MDPTNTNWIGEEIVNSYADKNGEVKSKYRDTDKNKYNPGRIN